MQARGALHISITITEARGCRKARCCQCMAEIPMFAQLFTGPVGFLLRRAPIDYHGFVPLPARGKTLSALANKKFASRGT
jgi:hypothetical protein